jgi:hypothetical protein
MLQATPNHSSASRPISVLQHPSDFANQRVALVVLLRSLKLVHVHLSSTTMHMCEALMQVHVCIKS